uniref:Uncharacterized protein n=1 Tax=Ascaris lumbricoides TaxID=6252 RepID=A0A0M3HEU6_ASCLU
MKPIKMSGRRLINETMNANTNNTKHDMRIHFLPHLRHRTSESLFTREVSQKWSTCARSGGGR